MITMVTQNDVTESLMTKRRIEYERLCFEADVIVGEWGKDRWAKQVLPGSTPCLMFVFERC